MQNENNLPGAVQPPPVAAPEPEQEARVSLKTSGWILIIIAVIMVAWAVYSFFAISELWFLGEPQRTNVLTGKAQFDNPDITQILYWISRVIWAAIGYAFFHVGLNKLKRPEDKLSE
jgi:hypothetical protein